MKNCKLVSSSNAKGFGLDSVKFLVDDTPYEYDIEGCFRDRIEYLCMIQHKNFTALNIAKRFVTLVNRDLINEH